MSDQLDYSTISKYGSMDHFMYT